MHITLTEKIIKLYSEGHKTKINAGRFHIQGRLKSMNGQFTEEECRIDKHASPGSGSEPGGDVFISSFPQSFTGEPK